MNNLPEYKYREDGSIIILDGPHKDCVFKAEATNNSVLMIKVITSKHKWAYNPQFMEVANNIISDIITPEQLK